MTNPLIDFQPPQSPSSPPVVYPQWPAPAAAYSTGGGNRPPNQGKINWLWGLIIVFIVVAVVRFAAVPKPSPAPPTIPPSPTVTTVPTPLPSSTETAADAFCLSYYVFSIDVTTGWPTFAATVAKGNASGALTMVTQFHSEAHAMQQADPPTVLGPQIDTVVGDLQTAQDALSKGSVSGIPDTDAIWANIAALQTDTDPLCG